MKTTVDGMTILGTPLIDGFVFGPKGGAVGTTQLPFLAQSVIDSAVMVWMQMGLTNDRARGSVGGLWGSAQKPTGGPICQANHAAPKLGLNIRPVTRKQVVGSLEPDGRLKFLSAQSPNTWMRG